MIVAIDFNVTFEISDKLAEVTAHFNIQVAQERTEYAWDCILSAKSKDCGLSGDGTFANHAECGLDELTFGYGCAI
jgi:hypothetical protein